MSLADHWNDRYENNPASKLNWFQESSPEVEFITVNVGKATPVIDIGGGLSPFVHQLMGEEFIDLTVLDVSEFALSEGQRKAEGRKVEWTQSDIRDWTPPRMYGLWHDRAVFHFLTEKKDQERYLLMAAEALVPGGYLILGTFSENGPESCSGLPVARHSIYELTTVLAADFTVIESLTQEHVTPSGGVQEFAWMYAVRN